MLKSFKIDNKELLPLPGETGRIITKRYEDNEIHEYTLLINSDGEAIEILEHYITPQSLDGESVEILNDSLLEQLKEKYLKDDTVSLTENDLE